jgi:hypothetical protein
MSPSPSLTSMDELPLTLPSLPTTANTLAPSAATNSANPLVSAISKVTGAIPPFPTSTAGTGSSGSIFGTRGIAIILGLLFIAGAFLLFLGDDIAGAVKIATKVVS